MCGSSLGKRANSLPCPTIDPGGEYTVVQTPSFPIPVEGKLLSVVASVMALRTLAFVVLALDAMVATTYLIALALDVLISIGAHLAILYDGWDSTGKLVILCMLGYVLVNVSSSFTRSLAASCRK
jgi:hypothetical protein